LIENTDLKAKVAVLEQENNFQRQKFQTELAASKDQ
jgi:hypothetical protein